MAGKKTESGKPTETESTYHVPVLFHESLDGLAIQSGGIYVDATFGGGGHSAGILKELGKKGQLLAFDQDEDAARNALNDKRFTLVRANFREMKRFLRLHEVTQVDGILADLGVSSWQFDTADRGFSYRFEGPLDMRMNRADGITAAAVLNTYDAEALQEMFSRYGEVSNSKTLALAIVNARSIKRFEVINDLLVLLDSLARGERMKYLSQVFQAIRIEVNDELGALKDLLLQSADLLKPGGRLAIITFHSLEDRLVKNFMKHGSFGDEPEKDFFGNYTRLFKVITKKPIEAGDEELKRNPRSRSARLRVAERL